VIGLTFEELIKLRRWLETAELPAPPLKTIPGVEAYDVELTRQQVLTWTDGLAAVANAVLKLPPSPRATGRPRPGRWPSQINYLMTRGPQF
jgi:hypothetical protein